MKKVTSLLSFFIVLAIVLLNVSVLAIAEPPGGIIDPECDSGGPGSIMCSVSYTIGGGGGGVNGTGEVKCTVECMEGYYACCSLDLVVPFVHCRCKSNGGQTDNTYN